MKTIQLSRRGFLKAGGLTAAAVAAPKIFYDAMASDNGHVLVNVFLRGGFDGLHFLIPKSGPDRKSYDTLRPREGGIGIPVNQLLPINGTDNYGLHPAASEL